MQRYAGTFTMALLACVASLAQAQSPIAGSATTPEMISAIRASLQNRYYKGCKTIAVLEVVEISPGSMRGKKVLAGGDKWIEKWRIDACGDIAVHPIEIEIVTKEGATALALEVKPPDEGAAGFRVLSRQENEVTIVRDYSKCRRPRRSSTSSGWFRAPAGITA